MLNEEPNYFELVKAMIIFITILLFYIFRWDIDIYIKNYIKHNQEIWLTKRQQDCKWKENDYEIQEYYPITSLEKDSKISWTFIMWFWFWAWWVWSDLKYYFYKDLQNWTFQLWELPWTTIIKEDDTQNPNYHSYYYKCKWEYNWVRETQLVVPKWTIKKQFNIN